MNDRSPTAIDRDLARLLSIAPSASFVPRVQQRVRAQTAIRRPRARWWIGAVAAAALVVLAVLIGSRGGPTGPASPKPRSASTAPGPLAIARTDARPVAAASQPRRISRHVRHRVPVVAARARDRRGAQAEVLVSRDQLRAIARLQTLIAKGDLTDKDLPRLESGPAIADIRPAPLTIAPLTVSSVETVTGGRESGRPSGR